MKRVLAVLGQPLLVPVWVAAVAALVLLPRLGSPGLWEPQEIAVADAAAARVDRERQPAPPSELRGVIAPVAEGRYDAAIASGEAVRCPRAASSGDGPGSLTERLAARGLTSIESADADMRLRLAGLAILCVVAVGGIALRLASARAALLAAATALSFPLLVLQARQLTSDIGVAAGAALIIYGGVALMRPARGLFAALDAALAGLAIAAGIWLGWLGGGALLGLVVPLSALALAGGLGLALFPALTRIKLQLLVRFGALLKPRAGIGRRRPLGAVAGRSPAELLAAAVALIAAIATGVLVYRLAVQIYDLKPPVPGTRAVLGHSILPTGCWSPDLGGVWRIDDDLRATYDSLFEQIAFGTFPLGILAPVAMAALALARDERRRFAGALTVAWAAAAWIAAQVWQRKVGDVVWPGFPAAAVGIGIWLDGVIAARERTTGRLATTSAGVVEPTVPARSLLVGVFALCGAVALGKDVFAFPDKLASLLVGDDSIKYPKVDIRWLWIPLRYWVVGFLGVFGGGAMALGLGLWWPQPTERRARWARRALPAYAVLAVAFALFWVHGWHEQLSRGLSSKQVFSAYREQRQHGEPLGILGDMANAPRYYAGGAWERLNSRDELSVFLQRPSRVFALVPAAELCPIHREFAGKPYFVLDDSNVRTLLLSNRLEGAADKNPLARAVLRQEPTGIVTRAPSRIVWDDKIELIGWTMPERVGRGDTFQVTLYFKILANVSGSWKIFAHFDGGGLRFQGDHDPIGGRCATSYWQPGDYVVDTFNVEAGGMTFSRSAYEVRVGFFTGSNPNWKNMPISLAPADRKDRNDRIFLGRLPVD